MKAHRVLNRLGEIRKGRGVTASDLARQVGVLRQTVYAMEAGTYLPNTELALLLAEALEVSVDQMFSLAPLGSPAPENLPAEVLCASTPAKGQPVQICQITPGNWVAVPVTAAPYLMPEADGLIANPGAKKRKRTDLVVFGKEDIGLRRLVLAVCDPATNFLSRMVERAAQVEVITAAASSKLALAWLKEGKVHIAGSHLEDPETGEFNIPYLRKEFPSGELLVVTYAQWEEGFVIAPGNPKGIKKAGDLARKGIRFINREPGSGSRALIEKLVKASKVDARRIAGFERIAYGHLAAAYAVLTGDADVCLATRSAAQTFHLDFVPAHSARYDLVMRKATAELPAVKAFLDVLQRATLRRKLEALAGYDTSQTGMQIGVDG